MQTVNVNNNALLYEDYIIVRNAKRGDIVTLSDGEEYVVKCNAIRYGGMANMQTDIIPYGTNDTADNR